MRCSAPWHSLLIKWHGGVFPDSQFVGGYGNLTQNNLETIWNSEQARAVRRAFSQNHFPEACRQCELKESSVGHSRRLFFRDVMDPYLNNPSYDPDAAPDIYFLEINSSNLCNLKCVMCNGQVSSAWIKDEQALAALNPSYVRPEPSKIRYMQADETWLRNLFQEPNHFRNLCYLSLKGGEPFLDPMNKRFMQFFIDQGTAKNIVLDLTTNGTIWDDELIRMFDKFKNVKLNISVEATGELYSYIRGGKHFSFDQLEANIKRFSNIENTQIWFATLAMAYNLWNLYDLRDWIVSLWQPNHRATFKNIVVNPRYLDPHVIPPEARYWAVDSRMTGAFIAYEAQMGDTGFWKMIRSLETEPMDDQTRSVYLDQFRNFTRDLDMVRGTSIVSLVPQLKDIL